MALYMSQVLHGLLYLHEQGVIHRDIKGANILTTKEGLVKLADFGVATKAAGMHEASVVGTPYWMAPEVIELSGATTASDIWSLGCTVIELLDGKPPYHKLQPMPALFRIVNDDHPPMPESISPVRISIDRSLDGEMLTTQQTVRDFLMQCFQKDPNLRVSARKLLKHPWIVNAKRTDAVVPSKPTEYGNAVKSVQQWNEALKSPETMAPRRDSRETSGGATSPFRREPVPRIDTAGPTPGKQTDASRNITDAYRSPEHTDSENWDDDFASSISSSALQLPQLRPVDHFAGMLSSDKLKAYASSFQEDGDDNWDDDFVTASGGQKLQSHLHKHDPLETVRANSPVKLSTPLKRSTSPVKVSQRVSSQPKTQIFRASCIESSPLQQPSHPPRPHAKRSSSIYREKSVEDYSDLVPEEDDVALKQKLRQVLDRKQAEAKSPKFTPVSDLKQPSKKLRHARPSGSLRDSAAKGLELDDHIIRRSRSSVEIQKYADNIDDEDFSDIFAVDQFSLSRKRSDSGSTQGLSSILNTKVSSTSWLGDEEDEDDPFAQLEENLDEMDMETKVARDRQARLASQVENLVASLKTNQPADIVEEAADHLLQILCESPGLKSAVISAHGLLPILEILEGCQQRDTVLTLLKIINMIIFENMEIQENFCFVGGIPVVVKFAQKKYPREIRLEVAAFVRQMYQTSMLTLQMFISCGGLNVLVEFLEEDYEAERDLVLVGVNGVWSVFELQGPTPKNDFCRVFSRNGILYPLSLVLNHVLDEDGEVAELIEGRIANIFHLFSQAENHVKESISDRMVLVRVLKDLRRMTPKHQITMLKFIKNLSSLSTTLDALQNSNAIETLTDLLGSSTRLKHHQEVENQILNIMFNLCRLSKNRQEDAALNGIIPLLQNIAKNKRSTKEFAIPILCDMAYSGKVGRKILWQNKALDTYVRLVADSDGYWQVTALDAIFVWLQEETAKVEDTLLHGAYSAMNFSEAIVHCFMASKADAFENLLEPLQKLLRLSPPIAATLAHSDLFSRTAQKINNKKAVVRGNLLRIIRSICDASEERGSLVRRYGLYDAIEKLAESDGAILVRNMATELLKQCDSAPMRPSVDTSARLRPFRRTSSSTMTPPSLYSPSSQPPTPQRSTGTMGGYFEHTSDFSVPRSRQSLATPSMGLGSTPMTAGRYTPHGTPSYRPVSRDGSGTKLVADLSSASERSAALAGVTGTKSRLPRTQTTRPARSSISYRQLDNGGPSSSPGGQALPNPRPSGNLMTPRRRRQTSGGNS